MTDWLVRAQHEIQNSLRTPTAKTAKTGVSAVTAVPRLRESGISGVGFVSFDSTPAEGFPENEGGLHPQREIQETSSQATAKTAETPPPRLSPAALSDLPPEDAACPWWRVSIVGPRALNIELEMRAAWSVSDWGRFARRHYGPDATVVARKRPEPEPAMPAESEELKGFFEEKAGILECAGLPKPEAEAEAASLVATLSRNRSSCSWASLRAALADYPDLLSQVPDKASPVDALPLGVATLAVRKDKSVLRQGVFSGPPRVTKEDQR